LFLCDKVQPALHQKQPGLLEHGVIFFQDNGVPYCHRDVQNLLQTLGWEVLVHMYFSVISLYLFG
jgi:hypothetical protein